MKKILILLYSLYAFYTAGAQAPTTENNTIYEVGYTDEVINTGFQSARFYYPIKNNYAEPLPIVIVMHGWLGSKEKMGWIAQLAAQNGFAALAVTASNANNPFTSPGAWIPNYKNAVAAITMENDRKGSPLFHHLNTNNISLVGHSMGAGGALFYADQTPPPTLTNIIALAPYHLWSKPGKNITAPTLILAGDSDGLATPGMTKSFYNALPETTIKKYELLPETGHNDFEGPEHKPKHNAIGAEIIKWLKTYTMPTTLSVTYSRPLKVLCQNSVVELTWTTGVEADNKGFAIERSTNGRDFEQTAFVLSQGSNSNYKYTDNLPLNGSNYYRLVQTDNNGKYTISNTVHINFVGKHAVTVYPNPAKDVITVIANGLVNIYDMSGRKVLSQAVNGKAIINIGNLAKGMYVLKNNKETVKFVRQ